MTVSVAMIGTGYFSQFHLRGWAAVQDAEVIALCDLDANSLAAQANAHGISSTFTDVATMLATIKPDLVDIVTPPHTHLQLVKQVAGQGIAAICQKPLAPDLAAARQVVACAEKAGTLLVVHENFRFSPWYREARRLVEAGTLGALHSVAFRLRPGDGQGADAYLARQPYFQQMSRFLVHETAIHFIDTFRYLVGEVTAVSAHLRRMNPAIAGEDAGIIVFEFAGGQTGLFDGNRLNEHPASDLRRTMGEMWLEGSAGVLRLDGAGHLYLKPHGAPEQQHHYDSGPDTFAGGACDNLQAHVIAHIRHGTPLENSAADYLRNVEIEEAVYNASETGRRIEL